MSKTLQCTFNDDLQKELKLDKRFNVGEKCYISIVSSIYLFLMDGEATTINIYEAKSTRMALVRSIGSYGLSYCTS